MLNLLYYILYIYIYIGLDQEKEKEMFDKCNCGFQLSCISGCCSGLCLLVEAVGKWLLSLKRWKDFCKQEKVSIMYVYVCVCLWRRRWRMGERRESEREERRGGGGREGKREGKE